MAQFCKLCKDRLSGDGTYHEKCRRTLFQLEEIIDIYRKEDPPEWLVKSLCELSEIYQSNTRTSGYFNVAAQVAESLILGHSEKLEISEISEFGFTNIPERTILELLQGGNLITFDDNYIYPSEFILKAKQIVERGDELASEEATKRRQEMFGFLAVCLTKALINSDSYGGIPQSALSIFHLLSEQTISAKENEDILDDLRVISAFSELTPIQRERRMRMMAGFDPSGITKIIKDIDIWGVPHLKECMVEYVNHMRERFRLRSRDARDREI